MISSACALEPPRPCPALQQRGRTRDTPIPFGNQAGQASKQAERLTSCNHCSGPIITLCLSALLDILRMLNLRSDIDQHDLLPERRPPNLIGQRLLALGRLADSAALRIQRECVESPTEPNYQPNRASEPAREE
ncbi:hypothetical protein H105_03713 [Trichophyton soudanense CBS 452.61]|uniref:Uncharacterized protein n=1 Tax=Trichophyton soudanense CBS 452.61 TaxID=1215331 RepID=A0A022XV97_TRISD|nr:hypothetical protein H105_03713 [Trichophyton soudanense CBS 452.61]